MNVRTRGFTLLEIMIVVVLIGILASLAAVHVVRQGEKAKIRLAGAQIKGVLTGALGQFHLDNHFYPTTKQGLEALVEPPAGLEDPASYDPAGYLDEVPRDPWGRAYFYECPGTRSRRGFDLWSAGPDRRPGTDDDIVNWRRD